jgi:hypothetical protein
VTRIIPPIGRGAITFPQSDKLWKGLPQGWDDRSSAGFGAARRPHFRCIRCGRRASGGIFSLPEI